MLATVSDVVWQAAIAAVLAISLAWIAYKVKVIERTGEAVHTLVNSNMGVQLKLNADLSRWKAAQTKKKSDVDAADRAEAMLEDHEQKQSVVDNQKQWE